MAIHYITSYNNSSNWPFLVAAPGAMIDLLRKLLVDGNGVDYSGIGWTLAFHDATNHIAFFREPLALGGRYIRIDDSEIKWSTWRSYTDIVDFGDDTTWENDFPPISDAPNCYFSKALEDEDHPKIWTFIADEDYGFFLHVATNGEADSTDPNDWFSGKNELTYFGRFDSLIENDSHNHLTIWTNASRYGACDFYDIANNSTNVSNYNWYGSIEKDANQFDKSTQPRISYPFAFDKKHFSGYEQYPNPISGKAGQLDFARGTIWEKTKNWGNIRRGLMPAVHFCYQRYDDYVHGDVITLDNGIELTAVKCCVYHESRYVFIQTSGSWGYV